MMMSFMYEDAMRMGVDEAVFIRELKAKLRNNRSYGVDSINGHTWVKMTLVELMETYPFWSKNQIRRIIASLKEQGEIITEDLSDNRWRRPTYYRLPSLGVDHA